MAGEEPESRVGLEHLVFGGTDVTDLPNVVHHREAVEPGLLGGLGHLCQLGPEPGGPGRPGEVGKVQSKFHKAPSSA